uniref:DNA helicase n=1 Tax=Octopus bimaculoides TaxID=37653 RepID=A0A0L8GM53_OCTBM
MNTIPTVIKKYKSVDSALDEHQALHYPTEYLNSFEPPRIPPRELFLKKLNLPKLCDVTRLIVKTLSPNVTEATIITGCVSGRKVFVPTIPIKPTDKPCEFKRTQFPV